jgi:hypothetical protein
VIHQAADGSWHSDLLGKPSYCNSSWEDGNEYITIVSASGQAEVDVDWKDVPRLVSDLMLLYERARNANACNDDGSYIQPTEALSPNLSHVKAKT